MMKFLLVGVWMACTVSGRAENLLAKANPGFEEGLAGWTASTLSPLFQAVPAAASMGKLGLRVGNTDNIENVGAILRSAHVPVTPGKSYRLTFWAGTYAPGPNADSSLVFYGPDGHAIPGVKSPGYWSGSLLGEMGSNAPYLMQAIAPEGAVTAGVVISLRRGTKGYTDIDDYDLEEVPPDPPGTKSDHLPPVDVAPLLEEVKADPNHGKPVPKIVIKIDDLSGSAMDKWSRVTDFAAQRKIKVGIGVIAKSLDPGNAAYFDWIKKHHDSGMVEFWFHGWDHANWTSPDGKSHGEFNDRTFDEQKKRFDDAERLARQKLGFPFEAFGPPAGSWDPVTLQVLEQEPDIKTFIYQIPSLAGGKAALFRVGSVNIEYPTFVPRYDRFVDGYVHNRGRDYFVIQGHPWHWNDHDFDEFVKIVDFLIAQGATFVTPSELGAQVGLAEKTVPEAASPAPGTKP